MAALTGTNAIAGKNGEVGMQFTATGTYTLAAALANGDTITWSNLLPLGGAKIVAVRFFAPELDTNATPTMKWTLGNSDDADGFIIEQGGAVGLSNSLPTMIVAGGTGALMDTTVTNRNVVFTVTAAVATGATTGTIRVEFLLEGI